MSFLLFLLERKSGWISIQEKKVFPRQKMNTRHTRTYNCTLYNVNPNHVILGVHFPQSKKNLIASLFFDVCVSAFPIFLGEGDKFLVETLEEPLQGKKCTFLWHALHYIYTHVFSSLLLFALKEREERVSICVCVWKSWAQEKEESKDKKTSSCVLLSDRCSPASLLLRSR